MSRMTIGMTLRGHDVNITVDVHPPEYDVGIMGYWCEVYKIVDDATLEDLNWELTEREENILNEIVADRAMSESSYGAP